LSEPADDSDQTLESDSQDHSGPVALASYERESSAASAPAGPASAVLPADVAAQLRRIDQSRNEGRTLDAHELLSAMYWTHRDLRPLIQDRIDSTAAEIFTDRSRHFAEPHFVEYGETLNSIAQQYNVPWQYLARLNGVSPKSLQAGQQLKVVRGPFSAVVDLQEFCLTVHAHGWYVNRYPIGIGRDQRTPKGEFTVRDKLENPTWYNPDGGIIDADDPANPLGEYWLGLGDHIGIHGTIDPSSIGRAASRGCIHLGDDDIAEVFTLLSVGSTVLIRQ
jgi:lipoprotein-anchoring transpeptidase ErfK/SrfK